MALLPFETGGFTAGLVPPARGHLPVSLARLIWGAMTVGATPISMAAPSRPVIELYWRAALAAANVTRDGSANRWVKTDAYNRLDRSEKTAVSYFLGMLQAKITCEMLLGIPHLVHLDAVLTILGQSTNKSRPDFVGYDLATNTFTVAVEAKGRTYDWTADVTATAKAQARLIPAIVGTTSTLRVASVAYFHDDSWTAYLEDPPSSYEDLARYLTTAVLLVTYYRPLVAALLAEGAREDESSHERTMVVRIPLLDAWLGVPRSVVTIFRDMEVPLTGPVDLSLLSSVGTDLEGALLNEPAKSAAANLGDNWAARGQSEEADQFRCTGFDGVHVELGPSWRAGQ